MGDDTASGAELPLSPGTDIDGWTVVGVRVVDGRGTAVLTLRPPEEDGPLLEVLVRRRVDPSVYAAATERHFLAYRSLDGSGYPEVPGETQQRLLELIEGNEVHRDPVCVWPRTFDMPAEPTLFLVPGHIGNPLDMGQRAISLLGRVSTVFVEADHEDEAADMLRSLNIDPRLKSIVGLRMKTHRNVKAQAMLGELMKRAESCCVFGVGEGTPAVCDPGSDLVAEAARIGMTVRSVGGASSLTTALMRLDTDLREFTSLGRLEHVEDLDRILGRIRAGQRIPVVIMADGRSLKAFLERLLAAADWYRGTVLAELTATDEQTIPLEIPPRIPDAVRSLPEDTRIILVLEPDPRKGESDILWKRPVRWLTRRFLGRRPG